MGIAAKERAYSTAQRCTRILARDRESFGVRKDHVAVANLTRIIEATLKLSNQRGFHSTTMRDLAQASGLSMGGLYTYVDSKAALVSMIISEVVATVNEVLAAPPKALLADPRAHLRWIIEAHVRLSEGMQPWFVFCFMEAKAFGPSERKLALDAEARTEQMIGDVIERGIAAGAFTIPENGLSAALIKPLLQDWYVKRAKYRKRGTTLETYIEAVTNFAEQALTASPAVGTKRRRA